LLQRPPSARRFPSLLRTYVAAALPAPAPALPPPSDYAAFVCQCFSLPPLGAGRCQICATYRPYLQPQEFPATGHSFSCPFSNDGTYYSASEVDVCRLAISAISLSPTKRFPVVLPRFQGGNTTGFRSHFCFLMDFWIFRGALVILPRAPSRH
jgi:hypothetical protein